MTTDSHIIVQNASLRFRSYRNPSPNLKETIVDKLTKKSYSGATREFDALKNVNLEIRPGDRLGILGLNGAGKSTLLKMIVGIYPPQEGQVSVRGKITPMIELGTGFDAELSGRENIYLNGTLIGRSYKQMKQLEDQIIEFSELGPQIDMPIKYYSSGMHARLAFSIGAIADPEILIMDEIFAAGDAQFVSKSLNRLHQMFDKAHILILVSHSEKHILNICNRAIVLNKGEIVMQGATAACVDHYMSEIVQDPSWTGADQWIINPLSFKDRKIMEQLAASNSDELSNDIRSAELSEFELSDCELTSSVLPGATDSLVVTNDIFVDNSGFALGEGWYAFERYESDGFRWVNNNAEIFLPTWEPTETVMSLRVEGAIGPALGRERFALKLKDQHNKIVDEVVVFGRQIVNFMVPNELSGQKIVFQVDSDGIGVADDDRILNFRIFNLSLRSNDPSPLVIGTPALSALTC